MKLSHFLMIVFACMITSCSSIKNTADVTPVVNSIVNFTVADMTVQPTRVSKTYSWSYNPFRHVSISTIKSNLEAELLNEAGADVLVEPQYIVKKGGLFRGGSVTVIGYPAKYSNFHKMTPEEAEVVKNARRPVEQKRHGLFGIFY